MSSNLIWMDLEMTGLDAERGVIVEIATLITDDKLEILAEGPNIAINYRDEILDDMDEWSKEQHTKSGLMERIRASLDDCQTAERKTLAFLSKHCKRGKSPLCGNSIWQDRRFLINHMPAIEGFCHYRNIDVSSVKELVKRWYPSLPTYEKQKTHLALDDIIESIGELKYYRQKVFVQKP